MTGFVTASRLGNSERKILHGFVEGPRPTFGSYHVPAGPIRDIAWLICPPLGWEGIQSYETVQDLADALAAEGFPTLRLHYDGTGESLGHDDEPDRVAAWLASVRAAADALRKLPGVRDIAIAGVRVGTLLAAGADVHPAAVALWEPLMTGAQYTREMEILAAGAAKTSTADGIEAGGYRLSPATVQDLAPVDLTKLGKIPALVLARDDRPPMFAKKIATNLGTTVEQIPGYKELMTYPERAKPGTKWIERTVAFAKEHAGTIEGEAPLLPLAEEAIDGTTRRRPVRFGPKDRMFGVLTEPLTSSDKPPVVLLTGGVVPRTGVNRMYVELATRLAERGHRVLRMDVSSICESAPADGLAKNDCHAESVLPDVETAIAALAADRVRLLGLCSGAYASFQTSLTDERVESIVLLNPEVFHLNDGSPKFSETEQNQAAKHYRESLMNPAAWKKLLTGKANVRYIVGFVLAKAKTAASVAKERISARVTKAPQGVAGDLHRLMKRGTRVAIVMAENDTGHEALMRILDPDREVLEKAGLRFRLTPGPDHTFNDFATRRPLVDWMTDILAG